MNSTYKAAAKEFRESSSYFGCISLVLLVVSGVLLIVGFLSWLGWVLSVIGAYFGVIHFQHRRIASLYRDASLSAFSTNELEDASRDAKRSAKIDVGGVFGAIFVLDFTSCSKGDECYQFIVETINRDKTKFVSELMLLIESSKSKFPEWKESLSEIRLSHLEVFDGGAKCTAVAKFKGAQGEFWCVEYDGATFSDLIWI